MSDIDELFTKNEQHEIYEAIVSYGVGCEEGRLHFITDGLGIEKELLTVRGSQTFSVTIEWDGRPGQSANYIGSLDRDQFESWMRSGIRHASGNWSRDRNVTVNVNGNVDTQIVERD